MFQVHAVVPPMGDIWIPLPTLYFATAIAAAMSKGLDDTVEVFDGLTCTHHFTDGECTACVTVQ